jgi:predicted lipoprotein
MHSSHRSPSLKISLVLAAASVCALLLSACSALFTVVPLNDQASVAEGGSATNKGFNKVAYVDKIWESKILPLVKNKAVPFDTLYTAIKLNQDEAGQKYGNKVGTPFHFLTKLEGQISAVNTESRAGKMTVDVQAGGKTVPVTVQIGPVLNGTALRDAVGFITFNEFVNQMQFADVADELNTRAYNLSLNGKAFKDMVGKNVVITGALSLDDPEKIVVMPVFLEVK